MGYYDDHYRPKKRSISHVLIPLLTGMAIGIFLLVLVFPNLLSSDANQTDNDISLKQNNDNQTNMGGTVQNLKVNVTSQITDVVSEVAPAVVGIVNIQSESGFWQQEQTGEAGTGSGVIYKVEDGRAFVVTNHHVIVGADEIEVVMSDQTRVQAELKGSDLFTDLAVLEMDAGHVERVVKLGDSNTVKVGEPAIAIGSPLGLHLSGSVTQGIISGKQRAIPQDFDMDGRADWQSEVIQTDAAINPGNSGGALINMSGQLVGINSMKIAQSAVEGIGFAIPINDAIPVIEQLEQQGKMVRAYLGVEAYSLEDIAQVEWKRSLHLPSHVKGGVYIRSIEPMSPAARAGLEGYDVITHLDGEPIDNIVGLRKHLYQEKEAGEEMDITYYREGEKNQVTVQLASQDY